MSEPVPISSLPPFIQATTTYNGEAVGDLRATRTASGEVNVTFVDPNGNTIATIKSDAKGLFADPKSEFPALAKGSDIADRTGLNSQALADKINALIILGPEMSKMNQQMQWSVGEMIIAFMQSAWEDALAQGELERKKASLDKLAAGLQLAGAVAAAGVSTYGGSKAFSSNYSTGRLQAFNSMMQSYNTLASQIGSAAGTFVTAGDKADATAVQKLTEVSQQFKSQFMSKLSDILRELDQQTDQRQNLIQQLQALIDPFKS